MPRPIGYRHTYADHGRAFDREAKCVRCGLTRAGAAQARKEGRAGCPLPEPAPPVNRTLSFVNDGRSGS